MAFHISGTPVLGISLAIKNGDKKKIDLYKGYVKRYISDEAEADRIVNTFEDPEKIVEFFIPKMIEEFKTLGLSVDWRRSYTSGDPEHQALVEWQFKEYKDKNYSDFLFRCNSCCLSPAGSLTGFGFCLIIIIY